jgi:hypothetical protein
MAHSFNSGMGLIGRPQPSSGKGGSSSADSTEISGLTWTVQPFASSLTSSDGLAVDGGRDGSNLAEVISLRPPITCLHCGSYLNVYAKFEDQTDRWMCPICHNINERFHSSNVLQPGPHQTKTSILRDIYAELRSDCFEVHELIETTSNQFSKSTLNKLYIFVVDVCLCGDGKANDLLNTFISHLQPTDRIAILVVGGTYMNILRLSSLCCENAVISDVLPMLMDQSACFKRLFEQQIHISTAQLVLNDIDALYACFASLAISTNSRRMYHPFPSGAVDNVYRSINIDILLAATDLMTILHQFGSQILLALYNPVALSKRPLAKAGSQALAGALLDYTNVGRRSLYSGCWIDIIQVGSANAVSLEALDALTTSTGGQLVTAIDIRDPSVLHSVIHLLKTQCRRINVLDESVLMPAAGHPVMCRVYSDTLLLPDYLTGPLYSSEEAAPFVSSQLDGTSAWLDNEHVKYTADCVFSSINRSSPPNPKEVDWMSGQQRFEAAMTDISKLQNSAQPETFYVARCSSTSKINIDISASRIAAGAGIEELAVDAITVSQWHPRHEGWLAVASDSAVDDGSKTLLYGHIQFVCKYLTADRKTKITRVISARLPLTTAYLPFVAEVDEIKYAESECRSLVAQFHDNIMSKFNSFSHNEKAGQHSAL